MTLIVTLTEPCLQPRHIQAPKQRSGSRGIGFRGEVRRCQEVLLGFYGLGSELWGLGFRALL